MAARRANPQRVKLHRSYSVRELELCLGVHKNTVRHWQRNGLEPIDASRPVLFQGAIVRAFLVKRNASRKCPCLPGQLYCFRCRAARLPAMGMLDYAAATQVSGNLSALCEECGSTMHRRIRLADLAIKMPGLVVQIRQATPRISGRSHPPQNCDSERQAEK